MCQVDKSVGLVDPELVGNRITEAGGEFMALVEWEVSEIAHCLSVNWNFARTLKSHARTQRDQLYKKGICFECNVCGVKFAYREMLTRHTTALHNERVRVVKEEPEREVLIVEGRLEGLFFPSLILLIWQHIPKSLRSPQVLEGSQLVGESTSSSSSSSGGRPARHQRLSSAPNSGPDLDLSLRVCLFLDSPICLNVLSACSRCWGAASWWRNPPAAAAGGSWQQAVRPSRSPSSRSRLFVPCYCTGGYSCFHGF